MSLTRFSLWGAYQFDNSLFDDIALPISMNRDILINRLMSRCGELYPYHQSVPALKENITYWFRRNAVNIGRMAEALELYYSPIENYDRYEEYTDSRNSKDITSATNTTSSNSESVSGSEGKVSAFNSDAYQPNNKVESSNNYNDSASSTTNGQSDREESVQHTAHLHGNIGVTTSTFMVNELVNFRMASGDIYDIVATLFEREFLVQVY